MGSDAVEFPPRPRPWQGLVDQVLETLASGPAPAHWHPVQLRGLTAAWVGVHCANLGPIGRPWVWDVVTSEDHQEHPGLRGDPLALPVDQDMVVVSLTRDGDTSPAVHLQVPVQAVPDRIEVSAHSLPTPPWRLELSTGWSTAAIGAAVEAWIRERVGGPVAVLPPSPLIDEHDEDRYEVGDELWASASAFDSLLERDPRDAAVITGCLGAVVEALEPWRRRAA